MDGWMDGWTAGRLDGWTTGRLDDWTAGRLDDPNKQSDRQSRME